MDVLELSPDYIRTVNYSLFHNRIPVCRSLEIKNLTDDILHDVRLSVDGEFITAYSSGLIAQIAGGETVRMSSVEISPDINKLSTLTERAQTHFTITVSAAGSVVFSQQYDIELMPYDFWLGTTVMPQTLASFVTPNHPSINALVLKTAEILKRMTGSSSLSEYQSGNINTVRSQVAAVFAAIHSQGIIYRGVPASYETVGQRVTLPEQVMATKIGNCIELSLLFASVLEAIGINAGIVLMHGHAYLAAWLVDDCCSCGICDDASFIEKTVSRGISEMLVLESTHVTQESAGFEDAVRVAEKNLADLGQFEMFVDIKRCRLERILPFPSRVMREGGWVFDAGGVGHDDCNLNVSKRDRYDLSKVADVSRQLTRFDIWERKLLDFSLRNSLLNLNLHRRAIQFISFDVDRIEDHLEDGEEYCISAKPSVEFLAETGGRLVRSKLNPELSDLITNDIEHHRLHTYLTEAESKAILKNIYRNSRSSLEETGANSLFLTIGTLRWFETDASETPRYAPILLLPVEMVYKKGNYYIRSRDEDITLNITLTEFLAQNYGIKIKGLDVLPQDRSGVDVPLIFALIRDALKERKRWDVEEECLLGTFSFSKFLMWSDIHNHRDALQKNLVIDSLLKNHISWEQNPIGADLRELDWNTEPAQLALPVPVDSSQMAAVIEAGRGHSFILYGPPGTGKSQTITNLIANALYHGKRVLFVAEKMAALSVVQSRLEKIGLGSFCLELHSNKSTKRHVLQQLASSLAVTHIVSPAEYSVTADKLYAARKNLIGYMNDLHGKDSQDGLSLYDCILRYEGIDAEPLANFICPPELDVFLSKEGVRGVEDLLGGRLEAILKLVGQPSEHPLNGMRVDRKMLMDTRKTVSDMEESRSVLTEGSYLAAEQAEVRNLRERILGDCSENILETDADALYKQWRGANAKWFIPRFFARNSIVSRLKEYCRYITAREVDTLIDRLVTYAGKHRKIQSLQSVLEEYFGMAFKTDELPEQSVLHSCAGRLEHWISNASLMREWLHWTEYANDLKAAGMGCVADALQRSAFGALDMRTSYLKAMFRHKVDERIGKSELLSTFEGLIFDEKVNEYKKLTEEFRMLTQKELYARLASRVPRVTDNLDSSSEIGLLSRNIGNGGRGLSLRDLFDQLPTLLPRLCPCMLMSPMSVAQFVDLSQDKFDLVVFDEASQMPTSEAVGAIARGKSLVVVGDPKQMPPTSFFSSMNVDEEEVAIDDMESILEDCQTLGMNSLQLSWHYRSRHEGLIAFSNNEYYDGTLVTFPSADDRSAKVHYVPVSGCYDKGGKRQNKAEAEAIIREIERRLRDERLCKKSIGVIAFSVMQQGLIEDMLQALLDRDKFLQDAAADMYEPVFVKNLENVQGDERDVILFSIGYGPDQNGKLSMNFGPLNNAGGERRLNVAVSRAREEMYVYSTMKASDIDLRRSQARGVEGLKHFLAYAETQSLPQLSENRVIRQDNLLAEQIAEALKKRGYAVKTNVGRSQFRVDVAVCDKDQSDSSVYRLGILLDGEGYRDTHTTRDREIVQPSVLNSLNWQVMRVWSVDWYNNPERVLDRIEERLSSVPDAEDPMGGGTTFTVEDEQLEAVRSNGIEYRFCEMCATDALAMSDRKLMHSIISIEQPVTFMHLCRRVCALRGSGRATVTVQRVLKSYLSSFHQDGTGAIWLSAEDSVGYECYRVNSGRDIVDIPQIEIENAVIETLREQVALNADNMILVVAKKLGFTRRGSNVLSSVTSVMEAMLSCGKVEMIGDKYRLKN